MYKFYVAVYQRDVQFPWTRAGAIGARRQAIRDRDSWRFTHFCGSANFDSIAVHIETVTLVMTI